MFRIDQAKSTPPNRQVVWPRAGAGHHSKCRSDKRLSIMTISTITLKQAPQQARLSPSLDRGAFAKLAELSSAAENCQ